MVDDKLVSTEYWRAVDRWWTDEPSERLFLAIEAPGAVSHCLVFWDRLIHEDTGNGWGLIYDPKVTQ